MPKKISLLIDFLKTLQEKNHLPECREQITASPNRFHFKTHHPHVHHPLRDRYYDALWDTFRKTASTQLSTLPSQNIFLSLAASHRQTI